MQSLPSRTPLEFQTVVVLSGLAWPGGLLATLVRPPYT